MDTEEGGPEAWTEPHTGACTPVSVCPELAKEDGPASPLPRGRVALAAPPSTSSPRCWAPAALAVAPDLTQPTLELPMLGRMAKALEFEFQLSQSNEYLRLISFRMEWLDLLSVQGPELWRQCGVLHEV